MKYKGPSQGKAQEMLNDGTVHGKGLSEKQRRLFQMIAHGKKPTRIKTKKY